MPPLNARMKVLVSLHETKLKNLQEQIDIRDRSNAKPKLEAKLGECRAHAMWPETELEATKSKLATVEGLLAGAAK